MYYTNISTYFFFFLSKRVDLKEKYYFKRSKAKKLEYCFVMKK